MAKSVSIKIWDQMEKLYGAENKVRPVESITTGSFALDDAIGIWGIPKGRIVQYAGKESSGKTLMSLIAIREWQKLDPKNWAVFIDAEYSYTDEWAQKLGVDTERLMKIVEEDGIKIFTQLCGLPNKEIGKPKSKPGLLDLVLEQGGSEASGLGLIVLDSIAAVQPPIESIKAVGNTNIAAMGRFLPDALRRLKPLLGKTGVTFIAINQVRVDVGKMFGDPTSTTGGKAWRHACDVMVHFTTSESKKSLFFDENDEPYGHIANARIDKNKVASPRKTCSFDVEYSVGVVNKHKEIADLAIKYAVIERPNSKTYVFGDQKWVGKESFYDAMQNSVLANEIFEMTKKAKESGAKATLTQDEEDIELKVTEED